MNILADTSFSLSNIHNDHILIFITGYTVVFLCLLFLSLVFKSLPSILRLRGLIKSKLKKPGPASETEQNNAEAKNGSLTGEEAAAISMALHLFLNEMHDEENRILTITKISKRYSPWNSKIYSVTTGLNKKF
jgi:Na+-transporting methylmalonyl-CoA/oxaloacetate decarboxylase gamma subunit